MENTQSIKKIALGIMAFFAIVAMSFMFCACDLLGNNTINTNTGDTGGQSGQGDNGQNNTHTQTTARLATIAGVIANAQNITLDTSSYGSMYYTATEQVNNLSGVLYFADALARTNLNDNIVVSTTFQKLIDLGLATSTQLTNWAVSPSLQTAFKFRIHNTKAKITFEYVFPYSSNGDFYILVELNFDSTGTTCTSVNISSVPLFMNYSTHGSKQIYTIANNTLYYLDVYYADGGEQDELCRTTYNAIAQQGTEFNDLAVAVTL